MLVDWPVVAVGVAQLVQFPGELLAAPIILPWMFFAQGADTPRILIVFRFSTSRRFSFALSK